MTNERIPLRNGIQPLAAFVPFAPLAVGNFHTLMPLRWVALFAVLQTISLLSFCSNLIVNDFVWCSLAVCAYVLITMPVYLNSTKNGDANIEGSHQKLTFRNLFRTCTKAIYSDYRISLLSKIPLALQVVAGGSLLYEIFGADWIIHALAGFGVGALALKAYVTCVWQYSYNSLASYFHVSSISAFKAERKTASAEFTLFSVVLVAVIWEVFERSVHFISPSNALRIGGEPLWNTCGDMLFAVSGGMIAWLLLKNAKK